MQSSTTYKSCSMDHHYLKFLVHKEENGNKVRTSQLFGGVLNKNITITTSIVPKINKAEHNNDPVYQMKVIGV